MQKEFLKILKTKIQDIDMLLMVGKGIRDRLCHSVNKYAKANNKYMKDYDENKGSSYLKYWVVNNF